MGKTEKPPVDVQHVCGYNDEIITKLKDADWRERLPSGCLTNSPNDIAYITDFKSFEGNLNYSFNDYSAFFKLKKAAYKEWKEVEFIPYNTKYGINPEKIIEVLRILHGGYNAKIMGEVVLGFTPVTWWSAKPIIVFMPYKDDYAVFIVAPLMGSDGADLELEDVTIDETYPFVEPVRVPLYYDLKTQTIGYSYNDKILSVDKIEGEWDRRHREYVKQLGKPPELKERVDALAQYFFGGFGNNLGIVSGNLYILKEPRFPEEKKAEAKDKIRMSFARITRKYKQIPFSELKKSPFYDDLKPLFEINELLLALKKELEKKTLDFGKIEGLIGKIAELGKEYAKTVAMHYKELTGKDLGSENIETRALLEYRSKEQIEDQARWLKEQDIKLNSFEKAAMDYYEVVIPELKERVDALIRYHFGGFGARMYALRGYLIILADPTFSEKERESAKKNAPEMFAWIKRKYDQIPFSELSKSPFYDDLKPLFKINTLLSTLEEELKREPLDSDKIESIMSSLGELSKEYGETVDKYYTELTGKDLGAETVETRALLEYRSKEQIEDQARWLQEQGIEPNPFEKAAMDYYGVVIPDEEPPWRRLMDVIKELEKEHGLEVPEDIAIAAATEVGIEKPEDLIYELKRDGILYSPAKGLIARVDREKPEPPAKEPWMMTYREFFDIAGSEYTAGERFGVPTNENGIPINPETGYPIKGATPEARIHRAVLMKALKEGKPMPEEVLKDYPDLVKKPPEKEFPKIPEEGITEDWMEEVIEIDNKVTPEIVVISTGYAILLTKYIPELKDYIPFYTIERKTIPEVEKFVEVLRYENVEWVLEDIVWSTEVKRNREIWYKEYTEEELRDKKVDEIREIAKIKNLSTKGKKSDLIARITAKPPKKRYFWEEKEVSKEEYERLKREEEEKDKAEIEKRIKPLISEAEAAINECDKGFENCLEFCDGDLEECYNRCHEEYEDTKDIEKCRKECEKERDKCHDKCEEDARECYEDSAKEVIGEDIEEGDITKAEEDLETFIDYISDELYKKLAEKLPKKVVEEERIKVRVLEDIPTFMGTDGEIYDLKKGDIVDLPKTNANVLCERGVTEPFVEIRPPKEIPETETIEGRREVITNIFDNAEVKSFMLKDIATLKIDNRYMYRGASKKELESLLNGGKSGGFWSNIPDFSYGGGVFLIAENKYPEYPHPGEIPSSYHLPLADIKAIYADTKNALFRIYPILSLDEFSRLFNFKSKTEAEDYYKKWYLHSEFGEEIKKIVEMALEEGKPVPKEVLRDYPDLVKKYEIPKIEEVKIRGILKTRYRCPICYRAALDNFCMVHSDVEAIDLLAADESVKEAVIDLTFLDLFKTKYPEKKRWTIDELHDAMGIDIDYAPEFLAKPRLPETYAQYYARELGVEIEGVEKIVPPPPEKFEEVAAEVKIEIEEKIEEREKIREIKETINLFIHRHREMTQPEEFLAYVEDVLALITELPVTEREYYMKKLNGMITLAKDLFVAPKKLVIKPREVDLIKRDYSKFLAEGNFPVAGFLDYVLSHRGECMSTAVVEILETLEEVGYDKEKIEILRGWFT